MLILDGSSETLDRRPLLLLARGPKTSKLMISDGISESSKIEAAIITAARRSVSMLANPAPFS